MPDAFLSTECRVAYEVRGTGPQVLFIQGVGVHGGGWRPQTDALAFHFRCLTFDNRGMGLSTVGRAKVTVKGMAEDALSTLDAEGWESAHVVGHSLGGLVALELALSHRIRVRSLSLLCTFSRGRSAAPLTPAMIWLGLRTRIGTRRMRRRGFLHLLISPSQAVGVDLDSLAAQLAPLFGHDLADQPPVVGRQLKAMRGYDATPRLGELAGMPTLVVSATHDRIAPPHLGRAIAEAVPGSRFIELPGASHGVTIREPERVNELLIGHLVDAEALRSAASV